VTQRLRLVLMMIGLSVVFCSLIALAYALWPMETLRAQVTLAPTVFAPP